MCECARFPSAVTDAADMRNSHGHTAGDRIETLDLDFLAAVCSAD
jgi:hypothetical protein